MQCWLLARQAAAGVIVGSTRLSRLEDNLKAAGVTLGAALSDRSHRAMSEQPLVTHRGGCHCGRVRFEARAPARAQVLECNCSICSRTGYLHLIVRAENFKLLSGSEVLTTYAFNTGTAKHLFCSVCGIKSFYVPRSHPDGFSVNARCLDPGTLEQMTASPVDGRQWEKQFPKGHGDYDR